MIRNGANRGGRQKPRTARPWPNASVPGVALDDGVTEMSTDQILDVNVPTNLKTGECASEGDFINWWCWKGAQFLVQVGNEQFYRCAQCCGIFRTGAA